MVEQIEFTRYEVARILGARALQIAMDAPLLLKIEDKELEEVNYDALAIAEKEFNSGVLPISVNRPLPRKKKEKLQAVKEDDVDDAKILAKEKEIEAEIAEKAEEMGFVVEDEGDEAREKASAEEEKNL